MPGLVEPAVGLGVHARDEVAGHGADGRRIAARLDQPLETANVGVGDLHVAVEREDQRHVDVPAARDHLLDRGQPRLGGGNLHVEVRPLDPVVEARRLLDRGGGVVGEVRIDLHRDVAVLAVALVPDRAHEVAGFRDVGHRELQEDLLDVVLLRDRPSRSWSLYQSPSAMAFWKIVGLDVTPVTASSSIIRFSSPVLSHSRESESIQTD